MISKLANNKMPESSSLTSWNTYKNSRKRPENRTQEKSSNLKWKKECSAPNA